MSKSTKILLGVLLVAVVGGGLYFSSSKSQKGALVQFAGFDSFPSEEEVSSNKEITLGDSVPAPAPPPPAPAPIPRPTVDLQVIRVRIPVDVPVSSPVRVTANVFNSGTAGSGTNQISVHPFILNGSAQPRFYGTVPAILPNQVANVDIVIPAYSFTAGNFVTFNVCADSANALPESNESNNCFNSGSTTVPNDPGSTRILQ